MPSRSLWAANEHGFRNRWPQGGDGASKEACSNLKDYQMVTSVQHVQTGKSTSLMSPLQDELMVQAMLAHVSIRQHTSAYVSIRQHTSLLRRSSRTHCDTMHTSEYVSMRQLASA
jgi:hypothetical protein